MVKRIGMVIVGATLVVAHCLIGGTTFAATQVNGDPCPPECVIDSMEIITYYPSPYGYYEELRGDKIIVGDSDISYIDETNLPPKGTITFSPMLSDPGFSDGNLYEGSLYYQGAIGGTKGKFRFYDGSEWQDVGGWQYSGNDIYGTNSGNVGIGTNSPGYKLDVQGGQINVSGGLCIAGDCKSSWSSVGGLAGYTAIPFGNTAILAKEGVEINLSTSCSSSISGASLSCTGYARIKNGGLEVRVLAGSRDSGWKSGYSASQEGSYPNTCYSTCATWGGCSVSASSKGVSVSGGIGNCCSWSTSCSNTSTTGW